MHEFVAAALKQEKLQDLKLNQEEKVSKWCEINFNDIQPENSPYRYSSFSIWYKATWNYSSCRLCVAIGGIPKDAINQFRYISSYIQ